MRFVLLQTREQVSMLSPAASRLVRQVMPSPDATCLPEYFLPRLRRGADPLVVAGYEGDDLAGVLYTYEKRVCGLRTGFVFGGDQMGRGLLLCAPEREREMLTAGCNFLMENGIHAMRLDWTPQRTPLDSPPRLQKRSARVKMIADPRLEGDWLSLRPDYDQFLAQLGPHTRRNLRYYRRKAEAAGLTYSGRLAQDEFDAAMHGLNKLADYPMDPEYVARDKRYMAAFGTPVIAGLRSPGGEFVSLLTGYTAGNHLHILTQLNREGEPLRKLSLSIVLRGYLIEDFIQRGFTAVHFFQGSSPMLGRFCAPVELQHISIDNWSVLMTPFKQMCSSLAEVLRRRGRRVPCRLQSAAGSYLG
jgi:hypothetical protein